MQRRVSLLVLFFFLFQLAGGIHLPKAEAAWDGSSKTEPTWNNNGGYYEISTPEQLAFLAAAVNAKSEDQTNNGGNPYAELSYVLTENLNLGDEEWTPIGSFTSNVDNKPFKGVFDGGSKSISGLKITGEKSYVGLFGYIGGNKAEVRNLTIVSPDVSGIRCVGGLAGYVKGTDPSGPHISAVGVKGGTVKGTSSRVGGLVGENYYATITSCHATGTVSGEMYVGGLVGENTDYATIASCYATGAVSGVSAVGGLAGDNDVSEIISSYATGAVRGNNQVGGLVGANYSTITASYATGTVSGKDSVGGLVGDNSVSTIIVSYATGAVNGSGENVGGLVGWNLNGTITSSAYDPQGTGRTDGVGNDRFKSVTRIPTKSDDWQKGWTMTDFDTWYKSHDQYYPQITSFDNHNSADIAAWSALSIVPVILSGDGPTTGGEDARNLKSPFALLATDADGKPLAWRIVGESAVLALSDDKLVVSPDATGKPFDLYATNGGGREKMFRLTTANELTTTPGLTPAIVPSASISSSTSLIASTDVTTVAFTTNASTVSVDISGPTGIQSGVKISQNTFDYIFSAVGIYTVTFNMLNQAGDSNVYGQAVATIEAIAPSDNGNGDNNTGGDDNSDGGTSDNPTPSEITVTIGGTDYKAEKQRDGTYLITLPAGTDPAVLKDLSLTFKLSDGTTFVRTGDYSDGPVTHTFKSWTVTVEVRIESNQPTDGSLITGDASQCLVIVAYNADGTVAFEIRLPIADGFALPTLDEIFIYISAWLKNLAIAYVGPDGSIVTLSPRDANAPYLRIKGTAASKSALESATLSGLAYWLKGITTEYKQTFDPALKISDMQITYTNDPPSEGGGEEEENDSSGGGGCDAGFGVVVLLAGIAIIMRKKGMLG